MADTNPFTHPAFLVYRQNLTRLLNEPQRPLPERLNKLNQNDIRTRTGQQLRFAAAERLDPAENYEQRIGRTGRVATRDKSWHDLFNGLVWLRFPKIKALLNDLHCRQLDLNSASGIRGRMRDMLTLFDESGAIVISEQPGVLQALARHDWQQAFRTDLEQWHRSVQLIIFGHAMLEKYLQTYKAMTAHCLLIEVTGNQLQRQPEALCAWLDERLADWLSDQAPSLNSRRLSPLPVAGVPGWYQGQDEPSFYLDQKVFRAMQTGRKAVSTLRLAS